jgi:hypothetical protein
MPKFVKKPVEVEARQFVEREVAELAEWCGGAVDINDLSAEPSIKRYTIEGIMTARLGDWIIKDVNGEVYSCKPDIFKKTYEEVEDSLDPYDIRVISIEDQPDGSAIVNFEMGKEAQRTFTEVGLLKVLTDAAKRELEDSMDVDTNVGC